MAGERCEDCGGVLATLTEVACGLCNACGCKLVEDVDHDAQMVADSVADFENDVFEYLDVLRESGVTNMYGAGPYVKNEFNLSKREARNLVVRWMETYSERHPSD